MTSTDRVKVFQELRRLLQPLSAELSVSADSDTRYCLEAVPGPATIAAWGGKVRRPTIPVAWVEQGKAYVSFHLVGLDGAPEGLRQMSAPLRARMQGKTCFNFIAPDPTVFAELGTLSARVVAGMRKAGFVASNGTGPPGSKAKR